VFSQYGKFCHEIFERYAKGEIAIFEMASIYEEGYANNVTLPFPVMPFLKTPLDEKYFMEGLSFFQNFAGFTEPTKEVEKKFEIDIEHNGKEIRFTGIIDRLAMQGDDLMIYDYKSKSGFKSKKEKNEYFRQLYLYSLYIKKEYGKYPTKINLHLFRKDDMVEEIFDESKLEEAIVWLFDVIERIESAEEYPMSVDLARNQSDEKNKRFFCREICSAMPFDCMYREQELMTKY